MFLAQRVALFALIAVITVASARIAKPPVEAAKPSIRGSVSTFTLANDELKKKGILASMLVEGAKEKDTEYDKASIKITDKTKIEKMDGKEKKPAKVEDIKKDSKLECTFTGPVAESYPVQATAGSILILETPKEK